MYITIHSVDALVVLGGGILPDGTLPPSVEKRVALAVRLWKQEVAPMVIFSGHHGIFAEPGPCSEAAAMAEMAEEMGVPRERILLEEESLDTLGNAVFVARRILREQTWTRLRVVTSDYHLPRALYVFQKVLGRAWDISGSPAESGLSLDERARAWAAEFGIHQMYREWLEEVPAGDRIALERVWSRHPAYSKAARMELEELRTIPERFLKEAGWERKTKG